MPEPQRGASMRILIQESKRSKFPPALLVTTLQNPVDPALHAVRCRVMFRIMSEVEGMTQHLLSKAFRRDRHRVRDMVRMGGEQNDELRDRHLKQTPPEKENDQ